VEKREIFSERLMRRPLVMLALALPVLIAGCGDLKVQPLSPGAYFPLARGPN
jgi:hypothetical protein